MLPLVFPISNTLLVLLLFVKNSLKSYLSSNKKLICFSGYIFIESRTKAAQFNATVSMLLFSIKEVYAVLRYGGKDDIALAEGERLLLKKLLGENDCIEISSGIIECGNLRIKEGPLFGMEHLISKIDRRNRETKMEVNLLGTTRRINVGLIITSKS